VHDLFVIPRDSNDLFARMVECYRDNRDVTVIFNDRATPERRPDQRNGEKRLSRDHSRTRLVLPLLSGNAELAREQEATCPLPVRIACSDGCQLHFRCSEDNPLQAGRESEGVAPK
jgi:hypothetical protein